MGLWFGAYWAIAHMGELACYLLKLSTEFHLQFQAKPLQQIATRQVNLRALSEWKLFYKRMVPCPLHAVWFCL